MTTDSARRAFIWAIANTLRGAYKPHEYGQVILPLTVLRRFDCVITPTRAAVYEAVERYGTDPSRRPLLEDAAGVPLYNTSRFSFEMLIDDPGNVADNLRAYIAAYSSNVQEIIDRFSFN